MIEVAESRDAGIERVRELVDAKTSDQIMTFSDGSQLTPDQKGCAFVRYDPLLPGLPAYFAHGYSSGTAFLTVYELELTGIVKALEAVLAAIEGGEELREAVLFVDNQSALKAALEPRKASGQWLSHAAWRIAERIRAIRPAFRFRFVWSPAHDGIDGNEIADAQAKRAASLKRSDESEPLPSRVQPVGAASSSSSSSSPPPSRAISSSQILPDVIEAPILTFDPPNSISALKTAYAAELQARRAAEWKSETEGAYLRGLDPSPPSRKRRKRHQELGRRASSVLTQIRTGFGPLNFSLAKVKIVSSPICERCEAGVPETLEHFALECRAFASQRRVLQRDLPRRRRTDVRYMVTDDSAIRDALPPVDLSGLQALK